MLSQRPAAMQLLRACVLLLNACANALTASLRAHLARFCSRAQELQGRLTKAKFEYVILAGSSFRCYGMRVRVDSRRAGCARLAA